MNTKSARRSELLSARFSEVSVESPLESCRRFTRQARLANLVAEG